MVAAQIDSLLELAAAIAQVKDKSLAEIDYCRAKLALAPDQLNPPPLLDGNDLIAAGIPQGPIYKQLLEEVRDAQLLGKLLGKDQALAYVKQRYTQAC